MWHEAMVDYGVNSAASGEVNVTLTVPICSVPGSPLESLPAEQLKVCYWLPYDVVKLCTSQCCFVLFFSRPRSESWPHHGCTFSIYLCPLSFWLTLSMWYPQPCGMDGWIKSNQIYLLKTSHLRVAIDKTVDEHGRQGSKEHLQWP